MPNRLTFGWLSGRAGDSTPDAQKPAENHIASPSVYSEPVISLDSSGPVHRRNRSFPTANTDYGFKTLVDGRYPIVDIIAIHGLNGHRMRSFPGPTAGQCWLDTFLSISCPRARIATYGYNATISGDEDQLSTQCMFSHGNDLIRKLVHWRKNPDIDTRRPIIFIAYSLGGLVLKHALTIANDANASHMPQDRAIKDATYGLIFLGTPPDGAKLADINRFLSTIVASHPPSTQHPVLSDLEQNSRQILQQIEEFKAISSDFEIKFIDEATTTVEPHSHLARLVEPPQVVILAGAPQIEIATFCRGHLDLVRFGSSTDPIYQTLVKWIEVMIKRCRVRDRGSNSNSEDDLVTLAISGTLPGTVCMK